MAIGVGSQLGAYEITALIGEGGMGRVFRARDTRLKRDVAIKALPEDAITPPITLISGRAGRADRSGRSGGFDRSSVKTTPRRNLRARGGMPTYRASGGSYEAVT